MYVYEGNPYRTKVLWLWKFQDVATHVLKNKNPNINKILIVWVSNCALNKVYLKLEYTDAAKRKKQKEKGVGQKKTKQKANMTGPHLNALHLKRLSFVKRLFTTTKREKAIDPH